MRGSFLDYLLRVGLEPIGALKPHYIATDDDLPRSLWAGEEEPLAKAWKETGEGEFWARLRQPQTIPVEVPECALEDAPLFTCQQADNWPKNLQESLFRTGAAHE